MGNKGIEKPIIEEEINNSKNLVIEDAGLNNVGRILQWPEFLAKLDINNLDKNSATELGQALTNSIHEIQKLFETQELNYTDQEKVDILNRLKYFGKKIREVYTETADLQEQIEIKQNALSYLKKNVYFYKKVGDKYYVLLKEGKSGLRVEKNLNLDSIQKLAEDKNNLVFEVEQLYEIDYEVEKENYDLLNETIKLNEAKNKELKESFDKSWPGDFPAYQPRKEKKLNKTYKEEYDSQKKIYAETNKKIKNDKKQLVQILKNFNNQYPTDFPKKKLRDLLDVYNDPNSKGQEENSKQSIEEVRLILKPVLENFDTIMSMSKKKDELLQVEINENLEKLKEKSSTLQDLFGAFDFLHDNQQFRKLNIYVKKQNEEITKKLDEATQKYNSQIEQTKERTQIYLKEVQKFLMDNKALIVTIIAGVMIALAERATSSLLNIKLGGENEEKKENKTSQPPIPPAQNLSYKHAILQKISSQQYNLV